MAFYKSCWDIQQDVLKTQEDYHKYAFLDKGSNAMFISLIPKKEGVEEIKDFRPISLVGSTYKIESKVLVCCMKEVMNDIISPNQSAFLGGRQSIDGVLNANECINDIMKRGSSGVLCKLDLEKAHDRVT